MGMESGGEEGDRAEVLVEERSTSEIVMEGNRGTCVLSFDADELESLSGRGGSGRDRSIFILAAEVAVNSELLDDVWTVPWGKPSPTPPGNFLVSEAFNRPSCEEFDAMLSFEEHAAFNLSPTTDEGRHDVDPFGLGEGDALGEGLALGVRLGSGKSSASSSSSIGDERKQCRESRTSGISSSECAKDDVDEEDKSLSCELKLDEGPGEGGEPRSWNR